ncbi:MalY/PatB family protein [Brevibacillus daliensis]|uniref:MalY/PatB family protein n=1 Tax=Brevibacillus daliensis TaxID=2892995 RepID=UPI001E5ED379|nr:PatB family C-S lyase [Brevibacillus daliensis]
MNQYNFDIPFNCKNSHHYKWDQEGKDVRYPLGVADTDYHPPQEVVDAVASRASSGVFGYGIQPAEFAQSISNWYQKRHNTVVLPEWTSYTPGLIVAVKMFLEALTDPGDNIIIQPPVYFNFKNIITRNERNVLENTLVLADNKYHIDYEDLEKKAADPKTKILVLCNPHNPIGHAWSREDLEKIADICNQHHVFVISDEAHSDILFNGQQHIPFITLSEEVAMNCATINSGGKTFNTNGLYTSYVIIPNEEIHTMFKQVVVKHHFEFNMLGGFAHIAAYTHGAQYTDEMVAYIWQNVGYLREFLQENMPEITMIEPNATYLMWLDMRAWNMDNDELHSFFQSAGVAVNRGDMYGDAGKGFVRINVACTKAVLMDALHLIHQSYLEKIKGKLPS